MSSPTPAWDRLWARQPEPVTNQEPGPVVEEAGSLLEVMVRNELRTLRARRAARKLLDQEERGPAKPFDAGTLAQMLSRPPQPPHRVAGLIPFEAGTLISAQRKTGKTTTVLNLTRCLLTGQDFLGRFGVRPVQGDIALLNFEVSGHTLAQWAADAAVDPARFFLVNLRGRRNPLGSDEDRGRLGALLRARGVETLICDPFGRAFTGTSQNDAGEVGAFLASLDQFTRTDVGAVDLILTAHAGWNGERTRGSSALEDWCDVNITLTRDDSDEGDGERYLRAVGRDVDVDEDQLVFDPDSRRLTLAGSGSRAAARAGRRSDDLDRAVLSVIIRQPGINGVGLGVALREAGVGFQKGDERKAVGRLVHAGSVVAQTGPRGARCYYQSPPTPTYPDVPQGGTS